MILNINDLHILLHKPEHIQGEDADQLEKVLLEFPYFQAAHALYLKSLYTQKSYKYNSELKKTAAYTTDRDILFDFITSEEFVSYKPFSFSDSKTTIQENIKETTQNKESGKLIDSLLNSISKIDEAPSSAKETESTKEQIKLEEKLELGKPLHFDENEKYSFQQWLQLSKSGPIEPTIQSETEEKTEKKDPERQKKLELIDKFIETNPKIITTKNTPVTPVNIEVSSSDSDSFMTETLAKIYLEQKKYQKAIQAYEILILKYPEKSSFFADQIVDIKALQQHNS